jgi:hypothetical protein
LKEGERLFVLGLDFDLDFDLNPLYVAPSIAGFEGIARRGAARKPHVDRQHTEVLSANPLETEKHREPEGCDIWVPFSLSTFFWAYKRKYLAAGPPPAMYQVTRTVRLNMTHYCIFIKDFLPV